MRIEIFVGTMTGTAELVAEEVADSLRSAEHDVDVSMMDKLDAGAFADPASVYLICTSTYGQGDVPDNAQDFFEDLKAKRPDLSEIRYGVIGLGDSTYQQTFNFGGKRFDDLLQELGAQRIGERFIHDAADGTMPEEEALTWLEGWRQALDDAIAQAA
ncbi:flavodoxin domain-containing protein [Marinibaculum pumilum]|uniref:Flavodoxin domain-containing protein n=1 Tax=Marinibaculum pumilum TaxID=1766165 RepID=A0ABV7KXK8_9PROT